MKNKNFFYVIGGSGFIGTSLCIRFEKKNYNFKIIDKNLSKVFSSQTHIADVRSIEELRRSIDDNSPIINLAAEHRDDVSPKSLYTEVNVGGAQNISNVAREKGTKTIIFTSTVAVYGFAPIGTNEYGEIAPFNDYGRTKFEAELVFREWQEELCAERSLVIIRPTVIFGEKNRGNVYNLLRQIASGIFIMVGNGKNRKSVAYVENVSAFIEYALSLQPGVHIFNYVDKPDLTMNELVGLVRRILGKSGQVPFKLPFIIGYGIGRLFDIVAYVTNRKFTISSIRVKKFCSDSVYDSAISGTNFKPPNCLINAFEQTIKYEFIEKHINEPIYFSE